ncbi:MAG TPA: inositol monophosphatase family protein [Candidatus Limnocylindrales bacterium]|nr:inositol monophosphatase family protein [Candidatus Limnocylindrales bacterium]
MPYTPSPPYLDAELSLAVEAARDAGRIQLDRYERLERIVHKSERDVVTEVDHLCEELILGRVREAFPDDAILAEESGEHVSHRGRGRGPATGAERIWVVDPLDGTVNYANGIPIFCVSIGLVVRGTPVLGVIFDPVRDELFSALAGHGARLDGRPIQHPVKEKLSDLVVSLALPWRGWRGRERRVRSVIRVARTLGSASLSLAYVGNGRFDAFIQPRGLSNWDVAAAGVIAAEGGAVVTDAAGGPWLDMARPSRKVGILAAARQHHAELLRLLASEPGSRSGAARPLRRLHRPARGRLGDDHGRPGGGLRRGRLRGGRRSGRFARGVAGAG